MLPAACLLAAVLAAGSDTAPLKVGVYELPGIVRFEGERPQGLAIDIWDEIARRLDLEAEFVRKKDIASLVADTAAGRVDILLGPLGVTEAREKTIDFTHPLMSSGMRIAVAEKQGLTALGPLASLLSRELVIVAGGVVALVVAAAHLLWFVERRRNSGAFPAGYLEGVREAVWWSVSTVMTGGCENKPIETFPGRLIAVLWMAGGITLVATLTGTIAAKLTAAQVAGSINGPLDLPGRVVGVMADAVSAQSVKARGGSVIAYPTLTDALDAAAAGEVDAVVHENHLLQSVIRSPKHGRFRLVGPVFDPYDFALAVPPGSGLREKLSTTILAMREDGTIDALATKAFGKHD